MNEPMYEPSGIETMKFDYDAVQEAYTIMRQIYEQADDIKNTLQVNSESAKERMRGKYKKVYGDDTEKVFDSLTKNIKAIKNFSDDIERISKNFLKLEMVTSDSLSGDK